MLGAALMNPGQTLGPYVIEDRIAEGGMGVVYRAKNRVTGQLQALKVVREELARNREFVDRFVREATIASAVRHPNLVETLENMRYRLEVEPMIWLITLICVTELAAVVRRRAGRRAGQMAGSMKSEYPVRASFPD